jgi:hypothetical protein
LFRKESFRSTPEPTVATAAVATRIRGSVVKMPIAIHSGLLAICLALMTALSAHAEDQTFAELLAHAKAQAAAGHMWAPAGDNMTETAMRMLELMPRATPGELAEFLALLQSDKSVPAAAPLDSDVSLEEQSTQAISTPSVGAKPAVVAIAPPVSPPVLPDPIGPGAGHAAPGQTTTGQITPNRGTPDPRGRASFLYSRGLDAELQGDVSGARRFYSSAAQLGDAAAARNLGRLYDPAYIKHNALGGIDPDPELARHWYERAVRLGDAEVEPLLEALSVR